MSGEAWRTLYPPCVRCGMRPGQVLDPAGPLCLECGLPPEDEKPKRKSRMIDGLVEAWKKKKSR